MAVVSSIRELRGFFEISLDGTVWLRLRGKYFRQIPMAEGDAIDPDAVVDRLASMQAADCYEAALSMLDVSARTRNDMKKQLMRKGFVDPAAEAVVSRLCENGLIDDQRYAQRIAQSQLNKPVGAYALRRKLRAKQLSEDDIECAMEGFDDMQQSAACREAAEKLFRKYAALPPREARAKLSQALARRGFGWDAVSSAIEDLLNGDDDYE